jgi:hypothetical protein
MSVQCCLLASCYLLLCSHQLETGDLTGGRQIQIQNFITHHTLFLAQLVDNTQRFDKMVRSDGDEAYKPSKGKKNTKKKKAAAVKRTRRASETADSSEPEADGPTLGAVPCSLMPHVLSYCGLRELSKLCLLDRAFNTEAMDDRHYLDKVSSQ